jgi:hypothetical protein
MTPEQEIESTILKMEARNAATRRMLDEAHRANRVTAWLLTFAGAVTVGLVVIAVVKAVGF